MKETYVPFYHGPIVRLLEKVQIRGLFQKGG